MNVVKSSWGRLAREADGFEGVEYAAMTALIIGAILAALISLGIAVTSSVGEVSSTIHV